LEDITSLRNGQLDLGDAMHGISKRRFTLLPCTQEADCELEGNRDPRRAVSFDWNPELTTVVAVGNRSGLYEVTSGDASGQDVAGPKISLRILACASHSYPSARAAFQEIQTLVEKWEKASSETVHSFLRAYSLPAQEASEANQLLSKAQELYRAGRVSEAVPFAERALAITRLQSSSDPLSLSASLSLLAKLYGAQGRYAEAEPLHKQALAIVEKALGTDHTVVAWLLNNLGDVYRNQSHYAEAEPLYKRSVAILEKAPNDPDLPIPLNNLAELYRSQGRYAEADPLYKRSLAIYEKTLGPDHADVATTLNNLAGLYRSQGRYADATPLLQRSLTIREKALGRDHPDVAIALNNLAELYRQQGRYTDAEQLLQRALAIGEKSLGPASRVTSWLRP
jgi:tetratricopeptide (TPR) repeat protein